VIATADFAYVRFHGSTGLYCGEYADDELARWAGQLISLAARLETVYVYFNNDAHAAAVRNARTMRLMLEEWQS
jgi:uncharacterized protein YecE (DUF72 family)